nr:hypothetical protein [Crucivirus sp.]
MSGVIDNAGHELGTVQTQVYDTIGLQFSNNIIIFPAGNHQYRVTLAFYGGLTTVAVPSISSNGTFPNIFDNATVARIDNDGDLSKIYHMDLCFLTPSSPTHGNLQISGGTYPTAASYGDLFVELII